MTVNAFDDTNLILAYQRAKHNCGRLILLIQEQIANPSQANVDAIVAAGEGAGNLVPAKGRYSLDGESYDWPAYLESLMKQEETLHHSIIRLQGNFIVRSQGVV